MLYGLIPISGRVSFSPEKDIPDLSGKVFLVTGGNVGLGKETILQLCHHSPARIYLAARTQSKAEAAIKEIQQTIPDAPIKFIQCDLTSLASVQTCAKQFTQQETRLDVLYLNAGVMALPPGQTQEGYEIQFGTNHVGHALLTKLLLPTLLKTAETQGKHSDVRIISLSSVGHSAVSGIKFEDLKTDMAKKLTWTRYGQSKLANILFVKELARRYPSITSVAVHPGFVDTDLYNTNFNSYGPLASVNYAVKKLVWTNVQEGARGQLWAGTAPLGGNERGARGVKSGEYYTPLGVTGQGTRASSDVALASRLWDWTEKEVSEWKL